MTPFDIQRAIIKINSPVIFDVGAHTGLTTLQYRRVFPRAHIYCFEPFKPAFEKLQHAVSDYPSVRIFNLAISDREGDLPFNSNSFSETNSLLPTDSSSFSHWGFGKLETQERISVSSTTIDTFCEQMLIPHIDILKLDIQGAEYLALVGARRMMSSHAISLIYSEIITAPTYEGQKKLYRYLHLIDSFGYDLIDLYNQVRKGIRLVQADFLFRSRLCQ